MLSVLYHQRWSETHWAGILANWQQVAEFMQDQTALNEFPIPVIETVLVHLAETKKPLTLSTEIDDNGGDVFITPIKGTGAGKMVKLDDKKVRIRPLLKAEVERLAKERAGKMVAVDTLDIITCKLGLLEGWDLDHGLKGDISVGNIEAYFGLNNNMVNEDAGDEPLGVTFVEVKGKVFIKGENVDGIVEEPVDLSMLTAKEQKVLKSVLADESLLDTEKEVREARELAEAQEKLAWEQGRFARGAKPTKGAKKAPLSLFT